MTDDTQTPTPKTEEPTTEAPAAVVENEHNPLIERLLAALLAVPAFMAGLIEAITGHDDFNCHMERSLETSLEGHITEAEVDDLITNHIRDANIISNDDYCPDDWVTADDIESHIHDYVSEPDLQSMLDNACDDGIGRTAARGLENLGIDADDLKNIMGRFAAMEAALNPPPPTPTTTDLKAQADGAIAAYNAAVAQDAAEAAKAATLTLTDGGES